MVAVRAPGHSSSAGCCCFSRSSSSTSSSASRMASRRSFWRENALTIAFILLFVLALVAQAWSGWLDFNEEQQTHHQATYSLGRYLVSSEFGVDVMENWQSEFLQFASFIALAIWLRQRGSTESKKMDEPTRPDDDEEKVGSGAAADSPRWAKAGGWRAALYGNSLLGVMVFFWLATWATQSVTGWRTYDHEQQDHKESQVSYTGYLVTPEFWN